MPFGYGCCVWIAGGPDVARSSTLVQLESSRWIHRDRNSLEKSRTAPTWRSFRAGLSGFITCAEGLCLSARQGFQKKGSRISEKVRLRDFSSTLQESAFKRALKLRQVSGHRMYVCPLRRPLRMRSYPLRIFTAAWTASASIRLTPWTARIPQSVSLRTATLLSILRESVLSMWLKRSRSVAYSTAFTK
jgi:hypothetical protein